VLHIESAPATDGAGYDVTLIARPTRAVAAIELRLAGQRARFGATAAGRTRILRVRIADGTDVVGSALVGRGRSSRSAAVVARIGTPAPPARSRYIEMVRSTGDGEVLEVREVSP
jgi:hypothetical protein